MARTAEDLRLEAVGKEAREGTDLSTAVSNLINEGKSLEDVQSMVQTNFADFSNVDELQSQVSSEYSVQALDLPQQSPLPDMDVVLGGAGFDLDTVLAGNQNVVVRSSEASSELGALVAPLVQMDPTEAAAEIAGGNDSLVEMAEQGVRDAAYKNATAVAEQKLNYARTPEEALAALKEAHASLGKPISIATLREYFVAIKLQPPTDKLNSISDRIIRDVLLAAEADKAANKVWEGSSFLSVLGDFGELVIPISGVVEEEVIKYEQSLGAVLDKVQAAPVEEQAVVLNAALDTWMESETLLLGNNNSLLTIDRLESIREAILDGGLGLSDGSLTRQEAEDLVFSALSGTILAAEVKSLGVGIKGLLKFLSNRIMPSNTLPKRFAMEGEFLGKEAVEQLDTFALEFRKSSRVIDAEFSVKPDNFTIAKQDGLQDLTKSAGLKDEEAIDRMTPNVGERNEVAFGNAQDEVIEINDLTLMDETVSNAGMKRGRELERVSGNSLKVVDSGITLLRNDDTESLGDFVFTFGDSNKKGFETAADAKMAGDFGFQGVPYETIESNGQFFNTVTMKHIFDPRKDVTDLYSDMRSSFNGTFSFLASDPLRVLGKDVLDGVFALKGVNRSKVTTQINKFNDAVKSFTHKKAEHLSKALKYGDDNGVEFTSKLDMEGAVGESVSGRTWEAYKAIREVMDNVYAVRNNNFRKLKESQGYRSVDIDGDGHLAKPITPEEVDGDIMDLATRNKTTLADSTGRVLVRLDNPIAAADGSLFRQVLLNPEDLGPLPTQLLNKRAGHVDRFYRDTGWTIKVKSRKTIDGKARESNSTTHIVKSRKEAEAIKAKMLEEGADPMDIDVVRSRENDDLDVIYGDESSAQFSYGSSHTRVRGERIRGSDGFASVLDPLESIQKSLYSLQREYDSSIVNSLRQRFLKQFAPYLAQKGGTKWSSNLTDMLDTARVPKEVANAADQWHSYIRTMSNLETSPIFKFLDDLIAHLPYGDMVDSAKTSQYLQRLTSNLIILGRPLYQVPQNLFQAAYVAIREPIHGSVAAAQAPFILPSLMGDLKDFNLVAKVLGVDVDTAKDFIGTVKSSGLWDSVGRADDFLRMAEDDFASSSANWLKFYVKKYGAGSIKAPFRASRALQESSVKMVNLYAYLAEFNKQVVKGKRPYNAATKKDISFRVQHITQTQNGINQFWYQNSANVSSLMGQFMQHTHRLLLDIVLDPTYKALFGKNLGRTASPFADTRAAAIATTATVFTMFGFNGIFGENGGQFFADTIRENLPDFASNETVKMYLDGGLINTFFNEALLMGEKGRVDISGKINPASFIDSLYDFYLQNPTSINLFGVTGTTALSMLDTAKSVLTLTTNPVMDTREKVYNVAVEMAELVKGFSDAERAFIAGNTGTWPYMSTLSGSMKVTEEEALYAIFNVNPILVQDYYNNRASAHAKASPPDEVKVAKVFIKAMNRELALKKSEGSLETILDVNEVIEKYVTMAKAAVPPMSYDTISQTFRNFSLNVGESTYKEFIKPYIRTGDIDDSISGLTALMQKAETPESKQEIKAALEFMENMKLLKEQAYGDK